MMDLEEYLTRELAARLTLDPALDTSIDLELRDAPQDQTRWSIELRRGRVRVARGPAAAPSFKVTVHIEDFRDLLAGAATLRACLIDRRVEIEGDLGAAMSIVPLIFSASES